MNKQTATLKILYTSDVHGNAMPISYGTNEPTETGLAKYATAVKQARKENEHVIVLDNGDLIQGTPFMTHYVKQHKHKENPMINVMNQIGIDGAVIGNHEFNFGGEVLDKAVKESHFPWISANILDTATNKPKYGPPYIIKTLNDIKIAITGVTTHYIPNWESPEHIKGLHFADAYETLKKWTAYIQESEKPDVLIASYHGGFERDLETGQETETLTGENQGYNMCDIEGIDVLLTGHQHRKITGKVNNVLVVQPGNNGALYGEITMNLAHVNGEWKITEKAAQLRNLLSVSTDEDAVQALEVLEASTQEWLDQPIGHIEGDMSISDPLQVRITKHPFIEFIQKVQMEESGVDISVTSLLNNTSKGFTSAVTMRDVVSNYMYPNTLVVLELTGKDIKQALEKSAAYFTLNDNGEIAVNPSYETPKPQHYNYDMWEGIDYIIYVGEPVGSRVKNITYHGQPLSDSESYHVVLNNYRATGGGNYDMFKGKPVVKEIQKDAVEIIRSYFERHQLVRATVTPNFEVKVK
ncbi:bifunctional metallophosphatase/5'-nucleotidase [Oceanobacillus kapialis]|uniref:Bifunctional metallophosphatase/5'-nucleotidase n=1 Tax=Oceanobacillus kapialis TaxID=481353 RepID=A0ABW5PVT7_9BACI